MRSVNSYPEKERLFVRDFRENFIWLLLMGLSFLLAGPFTLYLSGYNVPDLSLRTESSRVFGLKTAAAVLQSAVFAPLLLLALIFLAWRLFGFSSKRMDSDFYFAMPLSRPALFFRKSLVGFVYISLLFALYAAVLIPLLKGQSAELDVLLGSWCRSWLGLYLASMSGFSALSLAFSLCGTVGDSFRFTFSTQVFLPLGALLLLQYAAGSLPALPLNFVSSSLAKFGDKLLLPAPLLQLFLPVFQGKDLLLRLAVFLLFTLLAFLAFCRRPAERAENRLGTETFFTALAFAETLLIALCGGFFWEGILGLRSAGLFLFAFLISALLGAAFSFWLAASAVKEKYRRLLFMALLLSLIFCCFDLGLEFYGRQRAQIPYEKIRRFSVKEEIASLWKKQIAEADLRAETKAELFGQGLDLLKGSSLLPERQGLISRGHGHSVSYASSLSAFSEEGKRYDIPLLPEEKMQLNHLLAADPEIGWLFLEYDERGVPFLTRDVESVQLKLVFREQEQQNQLKEKIKGKQDLQLLPGGEGNVSVLQLQGKTMQALNALYVQKEAVPARTTPEEVAWLYEKFLAMGLGPELGEQYIYPLEVKFRFRPHLQEEPYRSLLQLNDAALLQEEDMETEAGLFIYRSQLSPDSHPAVCKWLLEEIFDAPKGGKR